jgi:SNF2 family DNA or RNA helicase
MQAMIREIHTNSKSRRKVTAGSSNLGFPNSVVFSVWTKMLDYIGKCLSKECIRFVRYDGSMSRKSRDESLYKFSNEPTIPVILMSLKAGGFGYEIDVPCYIYRITEED